MKPERVRGTVRRVGRSASIRSDDEYQLVQEARPGVILFRYEGWISSDLWVATRELMTSTILRAGFLVTITDGEECTGSEPEVREAWTQFTAEYRASVTARYFLARSAMLRMAVQTTAMTSDCPVKMYRERVDFVADVQAAFPDIDLSPLSARLPK